MQNVLDYFGATNFAWLAWAETREQPDHPNPGICVPGPRQFINNKNTTNQASTSYAEIPGGACCDSGSAIAPGSVGN